MCLKRKRKGACQIVEQHLQKARFVWQSPFRLAFIKFHANYWLPKKIKTNLVYFQVFRMQPFFSVRYLHTRKRRETYKRKARKAKKNPNQVLCQARLPNNGLMAVELVWINCFGHRWPIGLHSRHSMAPPQIPWWFIGPCSSVEWVSQQNRYGTYSWQVKLTNRYFYNWADLFRTTYVIPYSW